MVSGPPPPGHLGAFRGLPREGTGPNEGQRWVCFLDFRSKMAFIVFGLPEAKGRLILGSFVGPWATGTVHDGLGLA